MRLSRENVAGIIPRYSISNLLSGRRISSVETIIHPERITPCPALARFLRAIIARRIDRRVLEGQFRKLLAADWTGLRDRATSSSSYPVSPLSRRCRITDPTSCEWRYHAAFGAFDASGGRTTGMSGRDSRVSAFDIPYCASAYQQVRPVDSPFVFIPRMRRAIQDDRQVTQSPPITSVAEFDYNIRAWENRCASSANTH